MLNIHEKRFHDWRFPVNFLEIYRTSFYRTLPGDTCCLMNGNSIRSMTFFYWKYKKLRLDITKQKRPLLHYNVLKVNP